jgi:hypothetical protein
MGISLNIMLNFYAWSSPFSFIFLDSCSVVAMIYTVGQMNCKRFDIFMIMNFIFKVIWQLDFSILELRTVYIFKVEDSGNNLFKINLIN